MPRPVSNPPNPWHSTHVEWLGEAPPAKLEVFEEDARSILARNDSPDIPFSWSINPYRGCIHACAYCYSRRSHQYLGFGAGTDFDRKIVVKVNAAALLRKEFMKRGWQGDAIVVSGNTDCYQPLEATYGLTRACLEVCREFRNPVCVVTKGMLVRRDADVLADLARDASALVFLSIPFADDATGRKVEPWASAVSQRFETLKALADAGVPVGVAVSPVIPGLNDSDVARILERAHAAGAREAFMTLLRLPGEVLPVFEERLTKEFPERALKVLNAVREAKEGRLNVSAFGQRMKGTGPRWEAVKMLFDATCRRLGMNARDESAGARPRTFRRPSRQGELF